MKNSATFSTLVIFWSLLVSCSLPTDPGPQPTILVEVESETRINVFGVFRPDSGMSFIEVGSSFSLETAEDIENPPWPDPDVVVVDSATGEIFPFATDPDDTANAYWYLDDFIAQEGHTYRVTITAPDYDPLTGSTTVPTAPNIDDYLLGDRNLSLTINVQSSIQSYEIHLIMADSSSLIQTVSSDGKTKVAIDIRWSDTSLEPASFVVYGFERNLSEYLGTTISIKPQSYQPQEFYVEGGFGVIGALNFTEAIILGE